MAKKKSKEELDIDDSLDLNDEEESSGGNKLLNAFIVVVVIAIWLVIFGLLIEMKEIDEVVSFNYNDREEDE